MNRSVDALLWTMKQISLIIVVLVMQATIARADARILSAMPGAYTVEATYPNGKVDNRKLSGGGSGLDSESFAFSPTVKTIKIAFMDETGVVVWKGKAGPNDTYVLVPDGAHAKAVFAGGYGSPIAPPQKVVFMNVSGAPITLDLVGKNGVGANRGIVPGAVFDLKKAVKLDPKETSYTVEAKAANGDKIELESSVSAGHYVLVWKNGNGAVRAVELGYLH